MNWKFVLSRYVKMTARFEMNRMVGRGTFGVVYECIDTLNNLRCALKITQKIDIKLPSREIEMLKDIYHPNCILMIDYFLFYDDCSDKIDKTHTSISPSTSTSTSTTDNSSHQEFHSEAPLFSAEPAVYYQAILFKYYPKTLESFLTHITDLSTLYKIIFQLCCAVEYIHSKGICHRDIKPSNILLTYDNDVILSDFGCAKYISSPDEYNTTYVGSRYYRAPELLLGSTKYSTSVDIWSVGCVIYQCFTGKIPFCGIIFNSSIHIIE